MLTFNLNYDLKNKIAFMIEFSCLFKKLRNMEKEVLKLLLFYQNQLNYDILMDYDVKVKIREDLDISEYNFNNLISSLRKKGIIVGNKVNDTYLNLINKDSIQINFNAG